MPDFGFDGVSSSLAEFMSSFFLIFCIMYTLPRHQTTDSTRAVQGACYNQLASTLYTPAACQQSRKQHHTRAVVCPRCITVAFLVAFFIGPCDLYARGYLLLCDTCCHKCYNARYFITSEYDIICV